MAMSSDDYDYNILFNGTENMTPENHHDLTTFQVYLSVCSILIFCISMPCNSFMLWVLLRERAWKITSDVLLLQVTVSNLCFTATLPFLACNALHGWIFGEWACGVTRGLSFLGLNSSALILTTMTLHFYFTVVQPSCFPGQMSSKSRVIVASSVMWLMSAAASIKLAVNSRVISFGNMEVCTIWIESLTILFIELNMEIWVFFFIPFFIVTFCYIHMWIVKQDRVNSNPQPSKVISGVTAGFFFCLTPYNIHTFVESLIIVGAIEYRVVWGHLMSHVVYVTFTLSHLYPCLNPMFHMFRVQRFRRHIPMPCITSIKRMDGATSDTTVQFMSLNNTDV